MHAMSTVVDISRAAFHLFVLPPRLLLSAWLALLLIFLLFLVIRTVFLGLVRTTKRSESLASKAVIKQPLPRHLTSTARHPESTRLVALFYNMLEVASTFVPRTFALPFSNSFPGAISFTYRDVGVSVEASGRPAKQPYDAFLILDVEATCQKGTDSNWPNEIIEWPVCLLRWREKDQEDRARELYTADEFRSFVKPTWKPQLSEFCTDLTGITQADVDKAPKFATVLESFRRFLLRNHLIDANGRRLVRFVWCSDGPCDIRDFVVKQCFISRIAVPEWLLGDVLDVRKVVYGYLNWQETAVIGPIPRHDSSFPKRRSLNIPQQLLALSLPAFVGRQHSGIDDTRNIARVLTELANRGVRLEPNTIINFGRRWRWMGRPGQILEEYCEVLLGL